MSVDHEAVRDFIKQIHDAASAATKDLSVPGLLQLVAIHPENEDTKIAGRYLIGDVDHMVAQAATEAESGFNVYLEGRTVRPDLRGNKRGTLEETVAVFALVLDRDGDKNQYGGEFLDPTIRVETSPGNGHDWIVLTQAIAPRDAQKLGAEIRAAVGADHDTGNPVQPYRIAGTPNYPGPKKRARGRTQVHATQFANGGPAYSADQVWATVGRMRSNAKPRTDAPQGEPGKRSMLAERVLAEPASRDGKDRSGQFFKAAMAARSDGMTADDFDVLCRRYPDGCVAKYLKPRDRLREEIDRAWVKPSDDGRQTGTPQDNKGGLKVWYDDFYAYMPSHQYIFVPTREMWPAGSVNVRLPNVLLFDSNGAPIMDGKGEQQVSVPASVWLDKNRHVEQTTWIPGKPELIEDKLINDGGFIDRPGTRVFNQYRGAVIKLGNASLAKKWLDHVHRVYPTDAEHLIKWFAHKRQRPEIKINHALFLGGAQGVGKDSLLEPVKHAVGPWNFKEQSPQQILGRFNGFVKSVILRVSEARDLGDIDRFALYDHLKTYTAAPPDVICVDEKHLREHYVFNVTGLIITSNHKTDGIYLPADDRRHYVAWTDLEKADFTDEYWDGLWGWYERENGLAHVAAYLAELDVSGFNPKAPPPKTAAFWEIVNAGVPEENGELRDVLDGMINPVTVTLEEIASAAPIGLTDWLADRKNRRVMRHRLESVGYVLVPNPSSDDRLWKINGKRQAIYGRKDIPLKERLFCAGKQGKPRPSF